MATSMGTRFQEQMQNRRQEVIRLDLLERTKQSVASRIARVCEHFPPDAFEALVTRIAEIEIKYSMRERTDLLPARRAQLGTRTGSDKEPGSW